MVLGLILLLFSIFEMMNVYFGNAPPPKLFEFQDITLSSGQNGIGASIVSGAQLSQVANLFFWFVLMGFILFAGGKIASLGVNMIKDIQVQVRERVSVPQEEKTA